MRIVRSCGVSTIAACLNATRQEGIAKEMFGDRPEATAGSDSLDAPLDKDFCGENSTLSMEKS